MLEHQTTLAQLQKYGLLDIRHSGGNFLAHLEGTYRILKRWGAREEVTYAGLCHSIYGTDAFTNKSVPLSDRSAISAIIGIQAERLAYLFCAMKRNTLWTNIGRAAELSVTNRWTGNAEPLSIQEFTDLLWIALANNVEQRPRESQAAGTSYVQHYLKAESYFSEHAFTEFRRIYGLCKDQVQHTATE